MNDFKEIIITIIDISIVAFIIYSIYKAISGTRSIQILKGVVIMFIILVGTYFIANLLELNTFLWLYEQALKWSVFAFIVVFQTELRRIVMKLGEKTPLISNLFSRQEQEILDVLPNAVYSMAEKNIGALIVITRNTPLGGIIEKGVQLDSIISKELIESIFVPKNPLHDGAMIISENRISAAACLLPLTERTDLSKIFGTRHRAAIGLSEETDAVIVVVSEENGKVSIPHLGKLYYDLSKDRFISTLSRFLFNSDKINKYKNLNMEMMVFKLKESINVFKKQNKKKIKIKDKPVNIQNEEKNQSNKIEIFSETSKGSKK